MVCREKIEKVLADGGIFLIGDSRSTRLDQEVRIYQASERHQAGIEFECLGHGNVIRMARNRNQVFRGEDRALFEYSAANLRQS